MKVVSIIASFRNEEKNVRIFSEKVHSAFKKYKNLSYILYFINDYSNDNSAQIIKSLCKKNKNIKLISFAQNYGGAITMSYGLRVVSEKNYLTVIDCDMQDPISFIPKYLTRMLKGKKREREVVSFVRKKREDFLFQRFYSYIGYLFLNLISPKNNKIIINSGNFKIISPEVVRRMKKDNFKLQWWHYFANKHALINTRVYYKRSKRIYGENHFGFFTPFVWFYYLIGISYFKKGFYLFNAFASIFILIIAFIFCRSIFILFIYFEAIFLLLVIIILEFYIPKKINIRNLRYKVKEKINF